MHRRAGLVVIFALLIASLGQAQSTRANPRAHSARSHRASEAHTAPSPSAEERTSRYFESIRHQPSLLLAFLREMPKGGDLHNHLSGAVYAESYIQWAAQDGACIDRHTLSYSAAPCGGEKGTVPAADVLTDATLYQQVISAQSMRFFRPLTESGHDHFFNTFGKFGIVAKTHPGDMLAEVVSRAGSQHELYMELILNPEKSEAAHLGAKTGWNSNLKELRTKLMDGGIREVVASARQNIDSAEAQMHHVLACGSSKADPGCNVTVRYQYEVHRGLAPEQVFAEMLTGFELASVDPRFVDVNLVMPEDAYVPMHDFELHMQMLDYLHSTYPKVHIGLHAGELAPGLVPPDGLRFHIRDSIVRGHAERIGHGVDVMYENDPLGLLKLMAQKGIMVEICLTSNDQILGVTGDSHPLPMYLRFGVPTAIATDDEGVARSDMTQEYLRAVESYPMRYADLKKMARNSLEHAFIGEPLRGKLLHTLDQEFAAFEAGACCKAAVDGLEHQK